MAWLEKISGNYRIAWYGHDGKRQRQRVEVDGFPVRGKLVARDMLATWERDVARGGVGLADQYAQHRNRALLAHVDDWIGELNQRGRHLSPVESQRLLLDEPEYECHKNTNANPNHRPLNCVPSRLRRLLLNSSQFLQVIIQSLFNGFQFGDGPFVCTKVLLS